jgi:hypothetical protein
MMKMPERRKLQYQWKSIREVINSNKPLWFKNKLTVAVCHLSESIFGGNYISQSLYKPGFSVTS